MGLEKKRGCAFNRWKTSHTTRRENIKTRVVCQALYTKQPVDRSSLYSIKIERELRDAVLNGRQEEPLLRHSGILSCCLSALGPAKSFWWTRGEGPLN